MLGVPDWSLASWSWFGYGHWSLIHPWSKFWLSILILKVQRTSMSFKSSFGALEDAGGSRLGFGIWIWIWIWSLIIGIPMIQILALYLDLKVQKICMSFKSWYGALEDAGGSYHRFGLWILIWIWSLVFDTPIFLTCALSWFWMCKAHPCPLSPALGLWRMLNREWSLPVGIPDSCPGELRNEDSQDRLTEDSHPEEYYQPKER